MAELAKKRKVRRGHRSYVKKLIGTTNEADIMQEIEESETIKPEVQTLILKVNDILLSKNLNKEHSVASTSSTQPGSSCNLSGALPMTKQIRLPRLEVPKFSGKVHEWQEFWDGFSSAIHDNANLSEVTNFHTYEDYC